MMTASNREAAGVATFKHGGVEVALWSNPGENGPNVQHAHKNSYRGGFAEVAETQAAGLGPLIARELNAGLPVRAGIQNSQAPTGLVNSSVGRILRSRVSTGSSVCRPMASKSGKFQIFLARLSRSGVVLIKSLSSEKPVCQFAALPEFPNEPPGSACLVLSGPQSNCV
jgi:hypothetical protein